MIEVATNWLIENSGATNGSLIFVSWCMWISGYCVARVGRHR